MRRLALLGLLLALPFVAVPLVWAATSGGGRVGEPSVAPVRWDAYAHAVPADRSSHNLRHGPARPIESLTAGPRRIGFVVSEPTGVSVEVRASSGRVVRRLGHFTVSAGQRLVLTWDGRGDSGRRLPAGRYVTVVATDDPGARVFRAPFALG